MTPKTGATATSGAPVTTSGTDGTDPPNPGGVTATDFRRSATAATGLTDTDPRTDRRAASTSGDCRADVTSADARDPTREPIDPEGATPRPPRPAAERAGEPSTPDTAPGSAGPADTDVESAAEVSADATPNACGPANDRPTTTAAAPTPAPLTTLNGISSPEFSATDRCHAMSHLPDIVSHEPSCDADHFASHAHKRVPRAIPSPARTPPAPQPRQRCRRTYDISPKH